MRTFITSRGERVQAKSKVDGLRALGYDKIYWRGRQPFSEYQGLTWHKVFIWQE